jgi:hypothetical protein
MAHVVVADAEEALLFKRESTRNALGFDLAEDFIQEVF